MFVPEVWMVGDSLLHWVSLRAAEHGTSNLGLPDTYNVVWLGKRGMCWGQLLTTIQRAMLFRRPPVMIVVHLGSNDIETQHIGQFVNKIYKDIKYLRSIFTKANIIWSYILPRLGWYGQAAINRKRGRINRAGRVATRHAEFGGFITHNIDCDTPSLFRPDGIHLSDVGNDKFLADFSEAVKNILCP